MQALAQLSLTKLAISRSTASGANMGAQLKEAKAYANEALSASREAKSKELEGKAWHAFAEVCLKSDAVEDALRSGKKALGIFQEAGMKKMTGLQLLNLARMQKDLLQLSEATSMASQGVKVFEDLELPEWEARCRSELLGCYLLEDKVDSAQVLVQQTMDKAKRANSDYMQGVGELMKSSIHLREEQLEEAASCADQALDAFRAAGNRKEAANALNAAAAVSAKLGKASQSQSMASEAMDIFAELGDSASASSSLLLSNSFLLEDDPKAALKAAQTAKDSFREKGDAFHEGMALMQMSVAAALQSRAGKAVQAAEQAAAIFQANGSRSNEAAAQEILYDVYYASKDYDQAIDAGKQARLALKASQAKLAEVDIVKKLADAYLAKEEIKEALRLGQEGVALAKEISSQKKQVVMLNMLAQVTAQGLVNDVNGGKVPPDPKDRNFKDAADKAIGFAKEAVNIARKVAGRPSRDPQVLLGNALYTSAQVSSMAGKGQDALSAVKEAVTIFGDITDDSMLGWSSLLAADCHGSLGQQDLAKESAETALATFQRLGEKEGTSAAKAALDKYKPKQVAVAQLGDAAPGAASAAMGGQMELRGPDPSVVKSRILDLAKEIVGDDEGIDTDSPLMDSGMDSLSSLDFRSKLTKEFSLQMPSTMVFEYPSISRLTDFLIEAIEDAMSEGKMGAAELARLQ